MGNHNSVDGNVRMKSASQRLPNTQQFLDSDDNADPLRDFNLSPPSAAVIGAGVAGVHAAYELGKLGFNVTVIEEKDAVATGETQHSLPFVGVGLLKPSFARVNLREEFLRGIFPLSCPSIITRDHILNSIFSSPLYRWIMARARGGTFNDEEIMFYTDNLSRLSHQTVSQLAAHHPDLQQHIRCCDVNVSTLEASPTQDRRCAAKGLVPATTAHARPMMIDPVGWTRSLAGICSSKFNVRFAFGERVEGFNTYLKYNVETTRSIRVSKADPEDPARRVYTEETYDVVVLTAGANTGALTSLTSRLPIIGLSGVAVTVTDSSDSGASGVGKLILGSPDSTGGAEVDRASLTLLSGPCNLFGYHFQPRPQPAQAATRSTDPSHATVGGTGSAPTPSGRAAPAAPLDRFTLTGLLSLDTTQATESKVQGASHAATQKNLARMEAYVRVMCDQDLPLVEYFGGNARATKPPSEDVAEASSYTRAFTPDGVPIVDHCGGAFNTFVCSGFGDQAMDFAPGSAKILCQLVRHQAELLLQEDAQRQRALALAAMAAGDEKGAAVTAKPLPPSRLQDVEYGMQLLLNGMLPDAAGGGAVGTRDGARTNTAGTLQKLFSRVTGGGPKPKDTHAVNGQPLSTAVVDLASALPVQEWRTNDLPALPTAEERKSPDFKSADGRDLLLHFRGNPYATNRFGNLVKKGFRDITLHTPATYVDNVENALFEWADPLRQRINKEASKLARRDNTPDFVRMFIYNNMYYDKDAEEQLLGEGPSVREARQRVLALRESDPSRGAVLIEESRTVQAEKERRAREMRVGDLRATSAASTQ